jgi:hypothetical protein
MFQPNVDAVLARLGANDLVLDVGGWGCPFNRAQWVLDSEPYETRGFYRTFGGPPSQGREREWFARDTWVRRDICARDRWPFADKQFDFAICSHTLEDLRDPVGVCAELVRVAKRGYIEVPSREWETCRGAEHPQLAGLSHHRWLIDIADNKITFRQKWHFIHRWRFSFPPSHLRALRPEQAVQWLWWDDRFAFEEVFVHGAAEQQAELAEYVARIRPYPRWKLAADRWSEWAGSMARRAANRARRMGRPAPAPRADRTPEREGEAVSAGAKG